MSRSMYIDTSVLPSNVLNLRDDEFYSIIDELTGSEEAELMKIQSIRSVHSFLRIENIFDVLSFDSTEINSMKRSICFFLEDQSYLIKPGIKASVQYLRDLFTKKQKEMYNNLQRDHSNNHYTISTQTSMVSSMEPSQLNMSTTVVIDHRSFLVQSIDEWCLRNSDSLGVIDLKLIEGSDFFISVPSVNGDSIQIRCGCRTLAKLPRQGVHFQLSNYYRHLKTGKCSMIRSKLRSSAAVAQQTSGIDEAEQRLSQRSSTLQTTVTSSHTTDAVIQSKRKRTSNHNRKMKKNR